MPKNTRVARCVRKVAAQGKYSYGSAIAICQASTKQSYSTGKSLKNKNKTRNKKKLKQKKRRKRNTKKNRKLI